VKNPKKNREKRIREKDPRGGPSQVKKDLRGGEEGGSRNRTFKKKYSLGPEIPFITNRFSEILFLSHLLMSVSNLNFGTMIHFLYVLN